MKKHAVLPSAILLGFLSVLSHAQAPVPFISLPLIPGATLPGGGDFTLTINGTGFVSSSVVDWNGAALATQFVSGSQLTATVPAADISTANTASVTVVNSAPGGGTSNVAFFAVTANEGDSLAFLPAPSLAGIDRPSSIALGDFNGDGKLDLAVADYDSTVFILLGDGTGKFKHVHSPGTGSDPFSVAVGDFNGDGRLDLAVANYGSNTVSILLGNGAGQFPLASSPATGSGPLSVAVGDFNGDGRLDLAVVNSGSSTVSVLLGDGTGNFSLASSPATGSYPSSVAVGDFNGDGNLDLAVANECGSDQSCSTTQSTVSILLGDGTGNFSLASSPAAGNDSNSIGVGDFNGDGKLDLAVVNEGSNTVSVLLGDGTGNFNLASSPATGNYPFSVAVGDFNGDGKLDLAVVNNGSNTVSILLGDGSGNFNLASAPITGSYPFSAVVGDFNGDGRLDLAVVNNGSNSVSILRGAPLSPSLALSSTSLNFGVQLVGASSAQILTLSNVGGAELKITSIVASGNFLTGTCRAFLQPGNTCTVGVTFQPSAIGTLNGTLTITGNADNSPQTVSLTGVGTTVTLLPSSVNFGGQLFKSTSQPQTVTLTNHGTSALHISGTSRTGSNPGSFAETHTCGTSVAAGGSCNFSVTFTPQVEGPRTATLSVTDNGGASPQTVSLSGVGTVVTLLPSSLTFGNQPVEITSHPQIVTLTNNGTHHILSIKAISFIGVSDFSQTNTCGTSVLPGESCTISVTFKPAAEGARGATLSVTDNDQESPQTVSLTGTGT